jgi:hypothetical protein
MTTINVPQLDGAQLTMKAAIIPVPDAEAKDPNGEFEVILATPHEDRDIDPRTGKGEEVKANEWKLPLPDHITFDSDHGMDVKSLVGSGTPTLMDDGTVHVKGTYAPTEHGQMVRQLAAPPGRHIRHVSVTFLSRKHTVKSAGGKNQVVVERELLNGSFVTVPANPNAVILSSKAATANDGDDGGGPISAGSPNQAEMVQAIHNAAAHLGAECITAAEEADGVDDEATGSKSYTSVTVATKGIKGSVEDLQQRVSTAVRKAAGPKEYPWVRATFLDDANGKGTVVYELERGNMLARGFTDTGSEVTLDAESRSVSLITTVLDDEGQDAAAAASKSIDPFNRAVEVLVKSGMAAAEAAEFLGGVVEKSLDSDTPDLAARAAKFLDEA